MSQSGKISVTSEEEKFSNNAEQLTLFPADSLVNRSPSPETDQVKMTSGICGLKCFESFAKLNPDGSWLKTYRGCSQFLLDGSLEKWSETWPRAGIVSSGIAFRLPPLEPLTREIESGLSVPRLPTPRATEHKGGYSSQSKKPSLGMMAKYNLWPTPQSRDWKDANFKDPKKCKRQFLKRNSPSIALMVQCENPGNGTLSPAWVEWLMGLPNGWTDLNCSETAKSFRSSNGLGVR